MTKRIIIEGADGSGKTSLLEYLRGEISNLETIRNTLEDKQNFNQWWPMAMAPLRLAVPIHDRFFYSELVYGPVIRGKINAEPWLVQHMQEWLGRDAFLIYARPPREVILLHLEEKEQMLGVRQNINELIDRYDELLLSQYDRYKRRFYTYDWTSLRTEPAAVLEAVRGYLSGDIQ